MKKKRRELYPASHYPIRTIPVEVKLKHSRYGYRRTSEYETVFNDCLCGIDWVKAHYQDIMPETTIELTISGEIYDLTGCCKPGTIRSLMRKDKGGKK